MSSPPQIPSSPSDGRRRGERHTLGSPHSSGRTVDDAQLAQDIDAARQMSRARANSTSQAQPLPASSPRTILSPSSVRGVHGENAEQTTGNVNDYLGVSASVAHAAAQQPSAGQAGSVGAASFSPTFSHQPPPHSAHAAARFYMQHNRHGSNTSIDSASHFIDHRNQQGLGVPTSQVSPTTYARAPGRRPSSSRHEPLSPTASSALGASLRQAGNLSHYQGAEQDDDIGSATRIDGTSHPSSSFVHRSAVHPMRSGSAQHSDTTGAGLIAGQSRRNEKLVDVDDHDEQEFHSYSEQRQRHENSSEYDPRTSPITKLPHTPSRRPSLAEQDVCFPMHTPAIEPSQQNVDLGATDHAALDPRSPFVPMHLHHPEDQPHVDHSALPPGFPWTFDLGALEDYAGQERKRVQEEAAAAASSPWGLRNRSGAATIASTRDIKRPLNREHSAQNASSTLTGISPDSDDATFYSRRPRKFINIHGSDFDGKSSGRYQRKLALFEGAGSAPPPIGARSATKGGGILGHGPLMEEELARQRTNATKKSSDFGAADTKTPLLERPHPHLNSYHGKRSDDWLGASDDDEAAVDAPTMVPSAPPPHVPRSLSVGADLSNLVKRAKGAPKTAVRHANRRRESNNEKQFRFTFYSNALPNTIHARHLYELPAPGQSFEELLMGISPSQSQDNAQNSSSNVPSRGAEQGEERKRSGEAHATTSDENLATSGSGTGQSARGSLTALAPNRSISALTSALSGGRLEGTTAPNTGSNTPEQVPNARFNASNSAVNVGQQQAGRPSTGGGAASGTTAAAASLPAASIEKARAMPGGGFRVDQDPETCTWWLDVLCPTDQEMKTLSRAFGIHPLTTEDILMEETREKIELFRNYYLVCFRSFDQDPYSPTYLEPLNMYVIVFREGTLSFHFRATPHPQNVRRRIKQLKDYINVTSDWISYALIDDITDAFGPLIQSIEYEVDSIDELVLILKEAEQSDMLRRIGTCRKKVMGLLRLMGNKADVVKGLAKRCNENWSVAPKSDIGLYLSDIQDHLITMTQNLNHYEKILSRSHSNYLAQISIEMTDANNQINDVLSKLTALGTVIVPLNVITGLWGMNVHVPGQDGTTLDWFFGILGVMIALAVIGYFATIRYLNR